MARPIIVYVAGAYRAPTTWDVAENIRAAERVGLEVARLGAMPLIPQANTGLFNGQLTAEFWLEGTLELMRRCDAVVLVPGWEAPGGTRGEIEEAIRLGIPVFVEMAELQRWLAGHAAFGLVELHPRRYMRGMVRGRSSAPILPPVTSAAGG